jgi:cyclase
LAALIGIACMSVAIAAYQQPGAAQNQPRVIEVDKLKENLFVLKGMGGGGNTAVFVGANGVVVVDTKNPGWGQPILEKIKTLTTKPVTTIVNTHTHGDHVSGNVEFPATVEVITHENTKTNMQEMRSPTGIAPPPGQQPTNIFKQHNGVGMPKRTFKDKLSFGTGNDRVDLFYFGRGHTNGDAWVVFPSLRVMHAGDIFSGKNLPLLDANNGGSGVEIGNTLAKAHSALSKSADTIITGHSVQATMNDLQEYAQFNRDFLAAVQEAKKAGRTAEDFAKTWKAPASWPAPANEQAAATAAKRLVANAQGIMAETK